MPAFGPSKRRELVACLRRLGYSGPYAGGRHEFMLWGGISVTIPNPHGSDIGPNLLSKVLRQAQVSPETNGKHFKVAWAGCVVRLGFSSPPNAARPCRHGRRCSF